jgi:hypothetical protein
MLNISSSTLFLSLIARRSFQLWKAVYSYGPSIVELNDATCSQFRHVTADCLYRQSKKVSNFQHV